MMLMSIGKRAKAITVLTAVLLVLCYSVRGWTGERLGDGNTLLATVGQEPVTMMEFTEELNNYAHNGNMPERFMTLTLDGRKGILKRIINEHLLYMAARADAVELDAKTEQYLERLRRNLIIKQYLKEKVESRAVSETEMRAIYDANPERFTIPEKRRVRHIVVADRKEALELKAQLEKTGLDRFAEFAGKYNVDGSRKHQGELGWIRPETMVEEFSKVAFSLPLNQISEPVKTSFGYHLILVEEIKPAVIRSFAQVKSRLKKMVQASREKTLLETLKKKYSVKVYYEHLPVPK